MNASRIKPFVIILILAGLVLPGCAVQQTPTELPTPAPTQPPHQAELSPGTFGEGAFDVLALEVFQDYLYAGPITGGHGAKISRTKDGVNWEFVSEEAFGYPLPAESSEDSFYILDFEEFDNRLYVIMDWFTPGDYLWNTHPIQVWRTKDGLEWEIVVEDGFGLTGYYGGANFVVFEDMLYITEMVNADGFQIWRSPSGDKGDWTLVAEDGLGFPECVNVHGITVFKDRLFVVSGGWLTTYLSTPVRLWYSQDGETWTPVATNGFDITTTSPSNLVVYQDNLYLGVASSRGVEGGGIEGARIWRSQDGVSWEPFTLSGIDEFDSMVNQLFVFDGKLYANFSQSAGAITYYLDEDATWKLAEGLHYGYSNDLGLMFNQVVEFQDLLFYGKETEVNEEESIGQVWSWCLDCE